MISRIPWPDGMFKGSNSLVFDLFYLTRYPDSSCSFDSVLYLFFVFLCL